MKNVIYKIHDTDNVLADNAHKLEFYCSQTNETNPYRPIMELGIVILGNNDLQIDFSLDAEELSELIEYLENLQRYINKFNKESKPQEIGE